MFDRRRHRGALLAALLASGALTAPRAAAQDSEALRAQRSAMADSVRASQRRVHDAELRAQTVPDSVLDVAGVTLRVPSRVMPPQELRRVTNAIDAAIRELEAAHGPDGVALLSGDTWTIAMPVDRPVMNLQTATDDRFAAAFQSTFPVNPVGVRRLVFARASQRALEANRLLRDYAGGAFSLDPDQPVHYFTLRTLATAGSGPARRCARGVLPDCRNVLDPREPARWYDDGDLRPGTRPAPLAGPVRASLLAYAVELGGQDALRRLRSASPDGRDPLAAAASVAGVPTDTLIARWHRHLAGAGRLRAGLPLPSAISSLAWAGLLLLLATRRRGT
jgi:hypothetical protein